MKENSNPATFWTQDACSSLEPTNCALLVGFTYLGSALLGLILKNLVGRRLLILASQVWEESKTKYLLLLLAWDGGLPPGPRPLLPPPDRDEEGGGRGVRRERDFSDSEGKCDREQQLVKGGPWSHWLAALALGPQLHSKCNNLFELLLVLNPKMMYT